MATCVKRGLVHHLYIEQIGLIIINTIFNKNQLITELLMLNKNCKISN